MRTYTYAERSIPTHMQRDLYMRKDSYICAKRPERHVHVQKDLAMSHRN